MKTTLTLATKYSVLAVTITVVAVGLVCLAFLGIGHGALQNQSTSIIVAFSATALAALLVAKSAQAVYFSRRAKPSEYSLAVRPNGTISFPPDFECFHDVYLLLDCSRGEGASQMQALHTGLHALRDRLIKDINIARHVRVSIFSIGDHVNVVSPLVTIEDFDPPHLHGHGSPNFRRAFIELEGRLNKDLHPGHLSTLCWQPSVFLYAHGDLAKETVHRCQDLRSRCLVFAAACDGADAKRKLDSVSDRVAILGSKSKDDYVELFDWFGHAVSEASAMLLMRSFELWRTKEQVDRLKEQVSLPPLPSRFEKLQLH